MVNLSSWLAAAVLVLLVVASIAVALRRGSAGSRRFARAVGALAFCVALTPLIVGAAAPLATGATGATANDVGAEWFKNREVDSDSNRYARLRDPQLGAAFAYKNGREIIGSVNGQPFSFPTPPEGNVQEMAIIAEEGQFWLFCWTDPRDGRRAEFKRALGTGGYR